MALLSLAPATGFTLKGINFEPHPSLIAIRDAKEAISLSK